MAERIAIGRLVFGHGDSRRVIAPGESFRTEDIGMSDEDLKALDAKVPPVMRSRAPTPRATVEEPVTENREAPEAVPVVARGRRRAGAEDDL